MNDREPLMPEADDIQGCESFAAGFVAGAELDPEWIGDADRWTFASWAGYLGGRPDVVPAATRAKLEEHPDDVKPTLRRDMAAIVLAAHESFLELRRSTRGAAPAGAMPRTVRVGRNEPCPCGSGKKYKRCCVDARTPPAN